jgi:hypothetical protein
LKSTLNDDQVKDIIAGNIADPFSLLGAHPLDRPGMVHAVVVRAFLPDAKSVKVMDLDREREVPALLVHKEGLFEAILRGDTEIRPYHLRVDFGGHTSSKFYDCAQRL